jgi:hypothetical protein
MDDVKALTYELASAILRCEAVCRDAGADERQNRRADSRGGTTQQSGPQRCRLFRKRPAAVMDATLS